MAIDETGLTKGRVRKLNALRKSVGDDLAEEVFAKWLERQAASQAKDKPDPVAVKIVEALAGRENDPKFNLGNHGYTLRRAKGKGASGFIPNFSPKNSVESDYLLQTNSYRNFREATKIQGVFPFRAVFRPAAGGFARFRRAIARRPASPSSFPCFATHR